jgi:Fur family peroxide stress response transcriptional regulator
VENGTLEGNTMAKVQTRLDEMVARLREEGRRLTPQRMSVLKILAASDEHLSAQQIYERVRADFPTTSLATIYSTVTLLAEIGEVTELGFGDGCTRYDGNKPTSHPHLVCVKCRRVIDLDATILSEVPREIAEQKGYQIVKHQFAVFGICPECQAKG